MNSNTLRVSRRIQEVLDPVGKEDSDVDNDGKKNTNSDEYLRHRRKVRSKVIAKEGYSNWREDLIEVSEYIGKEQNPKQIKENPNISNKININPTERTGDRLSGVSANECVENLGGTLIELKEYTQECILEELNSLELLAVTDELLEEVVYDFFIEALEEGYDLAEIEEVVLESIENSFQLLTEEDNPRKRGVLSRIKRFVKGAAKKIARAPGYLAGLGARAVVRGAQELGKGAVRGYKGAEKDDDEEEPSRSRVTQSASNRQRQTEPSRSRETSTQSQSQPRRRVQVTQSSRDFDSQGRIRTGRTTAPSRASSERRRVQVTQSSSDGQRSRVQNSASEKIKDGLRKSLPHPVHMKSGVRAAKTYRNIGVGKKEKVSSGSYTPPTKKKVEKPADPWEGSYRTSPRRTTPSSRTTTVSSERVASSSSGGSSLRTRMRRLRNKQQSRSETRSDRIASQKINRELNKEDFSYQLTEKSESEQQQKLFGLALSVKRGTTPRSEVSSAVLKIVDTMSEKQIRDYAKTKHEGLPKKVTKEEAIREELTSRMIAKIIEQSDSMPTTQQNSKSIINSKKRLLQQQLNSLNKGVDIDV